MWPLRFRAMGEGSREFEEGVLLMGDAAAYNGDPLHPLHMSSESSLSSEESSLLHRLSQWVQYEDFLLSRSFRPLPHSVNIAQWNLLADNLSDAFPVVSKEYLSWSHRFPLLLVEMRKLLGLGCIVCCEEVGHFEDFNSALGDIADGYFAMKEFDGCAVFIPKGTWEIVIPPRRQVLVEGSCHCSSL